eukprot:3825179-Prymnesium_polylepis.2
MLPCARTAPRHDAPLAHRAPRAHHTLTPARRTAVQTRAVSSPRATTRASTTLCCSSVTAPTPRPG